MLEKESAEFTDMQKRLDRLEYGLFARRAEHHKMLLKSKEPDDAWYYGKNDGSTVHAVV